MSGPTVTERANRLEDGTPYLADWQQRCAECGEWIGSKTVAHGRLFAPMCSGLNRSGRRRFYATVAASRKPLADGTLRWNEFVHVAPTPAQLAEIKRLTETVPDGE